MSKYNKLYGKHVLILGGTKGIGYGVAEAAIENGARVTIVGSSRDSADTAVSKLRATYPLAQISGLSCDLSKSSVEADLEVIFQQVGQINHVVFTATNSLPGMVAVQNLMPEDMEAGHMRLVVTLIVAKLAARHLPHDRDSSLTLTSGVVAEQPHPGCCLLAYLAEGTKGLIRALALDLKPLRTNVVEPGYVLDTGLWSGFTDEYMSTFRSKLAGKMPTGSAGMVEDVAEAYIYCMKDRNCTGEVVKTRSGQHLT
ncbi:short chain dehydrogenase [Ilyonectria destructans]|nr:short chain dehydrogenase [Ilyonectria destructans]